MKKVISEYPHGIKESLEKIISHLLKFLCILVV